MERAATVIAMRQAQARAVAEAHERFAAVSLEELVSGHATDRAEVLDRSAALGWDLTTPRAALLASIDPPVDGAVVATALSTIAASARAALGGDAIVWMRSSTVAALIAPRSAAPADRRDLALLLQHELDARLTNVTVSIG